MRRGALFVAVMAVTLLLAGGLALAATPKQCKVDRTCFGTSGDDVITGTNRADLIKAGGGHDEVRGLRGDDRVFGGTEDDYLEGNAGRDTLNGGTSPDLLNDLLCGGTGNDELVESANGDTYAFHQGWGRDRITGQIDDSGRDRIGFAIGCLTEFDSVDEGLTINLATGRVFETSAGGFKPSPNAVSWRPGVIEDATGGNGGDVITGSADENWINGHDGADFIDVSGDPSVSIDSVDCGGADGDADTVTKDPADTIVGTSCNGDTVTTVP